MDRYKDYNIPDIWKCDHWSMSNNRANVDRNREFSCIISECGIKMLPFSDNGDSYYLNSYGFSSTGIQFHTSAPISPSSFS